MSDDDAKALRREIVWRPLAGWAALMAMLVASAIYGSIHEAPFRFPATMLVAIAMVAIVTLLFMQLGRAVAVVRVTAAVAIVWASFLFVLTFADILTR